MPLMDEHGSPPPLESITRQAASRLKLERLKVSVFRAVVFVAAAEALWALALTVQRSWIAPFPWVASATLLLLLALVLYRWTERADSKKVHREIDRRLHLPDLALSAGELSGDDGWLEQLRAQTLARTGSVDWRQVWPVPWPHWTRRATFSCVALFSLLGYSYHADLQAQRYLAAHPAPRDPRAIALEELFKDWDEAKTKDDELKQMMEKIAPLRKRLTEPNTNERQQFADMRQLEELVAAEKAKLEAQSLEPQAARLADALAPMEGMGALAAALRKKDFDKAAEQAQQAADKLGAEKAEIPKGAQEAGNAAGQLAQQLEKSGQQAMSESLNQFCQGTKQCDSKKMSSGMSGIGMGLAKQATKNAERKRISTQLAQLSFCKNPGQCNGAGMCFMPKLSFQKQQGGKNAGSSTDLNRFGAETQLASERHQETMNNMAGDGESETTTIKAAEGQAEARRGTHTVSFQEYQKLSQQAIADEALPVAHREAIKRYFEKIRPQPGN